MSDYEMQYPDPRSGVVPLPVEINVGGTLYTSTLQTLAKYQDSLLYKWYGGQYPTLFNTLKNQYFIVRDGEMFRHILNFCGLLNC